MGFIVTGRAELGEWPEHMWFAEVTVCAVCAHTERISAATERFDAVRIRGRRGRGGHGRGRGRRVDMKVVASAIHRRHSV